VTAGEISPSVLREWLLAWLGGAAIGVANGVAREATYGKRVREQTAHKLSALTGIAALGGYFSALERRWPIPSASDAFRIGFFWLLFTVAFEFTFGRLVARQSWEDLVADYDVREGRTWPAVLVWIAVGPAVVREANRLSERR
jgi:hypothetical protein